MVGGRLSGEIVRPRGCSYRLVTFMGDHDIVHVRYIDHPHVGGKDQKETRIYVNSGWIVERGGERWPLPVMYQSHDHHICI